MAVDFTDDGKSVITAGLDGTIRVWDRGSETWTKSLIGDAMGVRNVAVSRDGKRILSGGYDCKVRLWDIDTDTMSVVLGRHDAAVYGVDIDASHELGVSVADDRKVIAWDLTNLEQEWVKTFVDGSIGTLYSVAFSPDGGEIAVGCEDGSVFFLDSRTGKELDTISDHPVAVLCVTYSHDGRYVFSSGSTNRIWMWERGKKELIREFVGHLGSIRTISVSEDGKRLISGSFDRTVRIWDVESGEVLQILSGNNDAVYSVAISPDGKTGIAGSYDGTVRLWDVAGIMEGQEPERPNPSTAP